MSTTSLRLSALDTLFFRESRPHESLGGSELTSVFPPPPKTVMGAIRTAIGESMGVNWSRFAIPEQRGEVEKQLHALIGFGDDLGQLSLSGLWLIWGTERLFPAPLWLLRRKQVNAPAILARLRIGSKVINHLGTTWLPELPPGYTGYKSMEGVWLTAASLSKALAGGLPDANDLYESSDLFVEESRLGIARENKLRTVEEGRLYQTRHIRPNQGLAIEAEVVGLSGIDLAQKLVRFGGEGRLAGIEISESPNLLGCPHPTNGTRGLILTLLSPARFCNDAKKPTWLPSDFHAEEIDGVRVWKGSIHGVRLTILAAVIGKARREGGWDMATRAPRLTQSLIPAGSAWYCVLDKEIDLAQAIKHLHDKKIGLDTEFGRGRIACGLWNHNEHPNK